MKKLIMTITVVFIATLLFGCTQAANDSNGTIRGGYMSLGVSDINANNNTLEEKVVKNGDLIKVDYTGRLKDGTVFDSSIGKEPLEFTAGAGQMIKGFDSAVIGMKVNEKKTVELAPSEAYGEHDETNVITVDANAFANFSTIQKGVVVSASNGARGVVIERTDKNAVIDFNHELAGKTLIFEITIVSIN